MKKVLLATLLLVFAVGFSQPIAVSTTSHTVPQLVNNVLINSPCVEATNITWRTGTTFGSSNGIGYFQNTNPDFPMQAGVILSTGNAVNAAGPNTSMLNDGSTSWPGDAALQSTLAAAGITMTSVNASVLEFDFTPISSHFNFDFVFASEEYGNFQCQFSDAFAFLLTNMTTGVTTNLAVVPNTNTPISVVTIRDFLYNSSCPSANSQYFGTFNGGSAAAGSATNFNGQTKLLNASANLVPNTPYHIKLVIADRSDPQSDSAIFINSDSFNIGQDVLGLDLTVANNTAICYGQSYTLSTGLNPAQYTFSWTKDNVAISGATGPSINVTQPGNYGVTYTNIVNLCQPVTDHINVEYYPQVTSANPIDLYKCDMGAATYNYDLSVNTPIIKNGLDPAATVTYFASQANADSNASPLPTNYTAAPGTTIYVRVSVPNIPCYAVKIFHLLTSAPPVAHTLPDLMLCERSAIVHNNFVYTAPLVSQVLAGQSATVNNVSFYTSQANANSGTSPITVGFMLATTGTTVYVRVQNATDPSCYSTTSFNVTVNPLPPIDQMADVIVCDQYILPPLTNGNYFTGLNGTGTPLFAGNVITQTQTIYIYNQSTGPNSCAANTQFKVTIIKPNEISPAGGTFCGSYTLPPLPQGHYHTAAGGGGDIIPAGTVIDHTETIYFYFVTESEPFCVIDSGVDIVILNAPQLPAFANIIECNSYTLPSLPAGAHYFTQTGGGGTEIPAGSAITSTQDVYVYATGGNTAHPCISEAQFTVTIGLANPADITQCMPYTLPMQASAHYYTGANMTGTEIPGGTVINSTQTVYLHVDNGSNCVADLHYIINIGQPQVDTLQDVTRCETYTLPDLVHGNYYTGPGKTGIELFNGDVILNTQTIYIYAEAGACTNETSFVVTINPLPAIDSRSDIDICNSYTLTALSAGTYYTGEGGTGNVLTAGTVITTSQKIYIYAPGTGTTGCTAENSFDINIFSIEADQPANVTACDSYILPALTIGNYYANPGGPSNNTAMLHAGDAITASATLYVYTESGERINCTDENSFTVTINHSPVVPQFATQHACNSYTLPALTVGNYFTATGGTGTQLHEGDVLTTNQTVYIYAQTGTVPNCSDEKSFAVDIFKVDHLPDATTCESFTLPALAVGGYYTGPNGTGTHLAAGTNVTQTETVYVYAVSPFSPTCSSETSFNVTIIDTPVAHPVTSAMTTVCDEDGTNDGITSFDLTQLNATTLGNQTGAEFNVTYYPTAADANAGTNAITSTTATTVYVRVNNTLAPLCFDVKPVTIHVNKLPEPTPQDGIICFNTQTQTLISPYTIYSGLGAGYTFQWHNELGAVVGTASGYTATTPGVYTVTATRVSTGCASVPTPVTVSPSEPAVITYSITDDFSDEQSVTVIATGSGDYIYQLDNGAWQTSNIFSNVASGIHTINVHDTHECGDATASALVVNYPHYFTPNGDGIHDTWNIVDLTASQPDAKITIFDRYGKFLAQITPSGRGWDGTLQGSQLPSTDYWFTIEYQEDGVRKEFRSHFAMKR